MPTATLSPAEEGHLLRPWLAHLREPGPPPAPPLAVTPALMRWASGIATAVAKGHRLTGQEREDIRSTAYLELVRHAAAWNAESARLLTADPEEVYGAFRGYAARGVRFGCLREAERLRAGGTIGVQRRGRDKDGTRRRPVFADPLSCLLTPAGDPFDVADREPEEGPDPVEEWVVTR